MDNTVWERLAASLTADSTAVVEHLPYLLQDLYLLGSDPVQMERILRQHRPHTEGLRVLDLGCGKGAVSLHLAETLGVQVRGVDLLPEFVEQAKVRAAARGLEGLCSFVVGDVNEAVRLERGYDCVIAGAVGDILGDPRQMLDKLADTVKPGGLIMIDDAYLQEGAQNEQVGYQNYDYLTMPQWFALFMDMKLELVGYDDTGDNQGQQADEVMPLITARAAELSERYPNLKAEFDRYVENQWAEYKDMDETVQSVVWLLEKHR